LSVTLILFPFLTKHGASARFSNLCDPRRNRIRPQDEDQHYYMRFFAAPQRELPNAHKNITKEEFSI
jgi:hypothetical protein